ncbi:hypothetical protein [Halegenticoccus tardaugens]|uniref:hypothetical protein n=1 Tax=Halegenticoccus tardaugens TaxID=2071624 RepID=UPI00100A6617|nr:hypothetical protein [Halegenticoccus tardaugens]
MNDSNEREALAEKRERNRERRIEAVKRWVAYIEENPPETRGPQQNKLVNAQLQSARESGLNAEHYLRVRKSGEDDRR